VEKSSKEQVDWFQVLVWMGIVLFGVSFWTIVYYGICKVADLL